jgi:hypothetical protein
MKKKVIGREREERDRERNKGRRFKKEREIFIEKDFTLY